MKMLIPSVETGQVHPLAETVITLTGHAVRYRATKPYFTIGISRSSRALFYAVALRLDPGQIAFEPLDFRTLLVPWRPPSRFACRPFAQLLELATQHTFVQAQVLRDRGYCFCRL